MVEEYEESKHAFMEAVWVAENKEIYAFWVIVVEFMDLMDSISIIDFSNTNPIVVQKMENLRSKILEYESTISDINVNMWWMCVKVYLLDF